MTTSKQVVIAIDTAVDSTTIAVYESRMQNLFLRNVSPSISHYREGKPLNYRTYLDELHKLIENCRKEIDKDYVAIGISAPNADYAAGKITEPTKHPWGEISICEDLSKKHNIPAFVINDTKASAWGEMHQRDHSEGKEKAFRNFLFLLLDEGLGGALVKEHRIVHGTNQLAGEIGHSTVVYENGRLCDGCQRRGCLEAYVSVRGLRDTIEEILKEKTRSNSRLNGTDLGKLSVDEIIHYAEIGDNVALHAFKKTGEWLGRALANFAVLIDTEAVIISGALGDAGDLLIDSAKRTMEQHIYQPFRDKVQILKSPYPKVSNRLLGAGLLAWDEYKKIALPNDDV